MDIITAAFVGTVFGILVGVIIMCLLFLVSEKKAAKAVQTAKPAVGSDYLAEPQLNHLADRFVELEIEQVLRISFNQYLANPCHYDAMVTAYRQGQGLNINRGVISPAAKGRKEAQHRRLVASIQPAFKA